MKREGASIRDREEVAGWDQARGERWKTKGMAFVKTMPREAGTLADRLQSVLGSSNQHTVLFPPQPEYMRLEPRGGKEVALPRTLNNSFTGFFLPPL